MGGDLPLGVSSSPCTPPKPPCCEAYILFFARRNQSSSAFFSFSQLVFFLSAVGRARLLIAAVVTRRPKEMTDTLGVLARTSTAAPRTRCTGREGACTAASHYGLVPSSAQVEEFCLFSSIDFITFDSRSSHVIQHHVNLCFNLFGLAAHNQHATRQARRPTWVSDYKYLYHRL